MTPNAEAPSSPYPPGVGASSTKSGREPSSPDDPAGRVESSQEKEEQLAREQEAQQETDRLAKVWFKEEAEKAKQEAEWFTKTKKEAHRLTTEQAAKNEAERVAKDQSEKQEAERLAKEQAGKDQVNKEQPARAAARLVQQVVANAEAESFANGEEGGGIDTVAGDDGAENNTLLHLCVRANNFKTCRLLIIGKTDVNQVDHAGQSPLHIASASGNLAITSLLLEHDSVPNLRDQWGETSLHMVSQLTLLSPALQDVATAVPDAPSDGSIAIRENMLHRKAAEVAKQLLNGRACPDNPGKRINTANANIPDDQGRTALHSAALRGAYLVCDAIVENGNVDLAAVDHHGETALHLAVRGGSVSCVLFLLSAGDNSSASSPKKRAANGGGALISCTNKMQETPLHMACMMEHSSATSVICAMLDRGASVKCREKYGRTPLHLWCDRDDVELDDSEPDKVVQLILKQNLAAKDARTSTGATPLHLAVSRGRIAAVKELMKQGSSICAIASVNGMNLESLEDGVGLADCFTALTALRIGQYPGSLTKNRLAQAREEEEEASDNTPFTDNEPPLSSSYSSPLNPACEAQWSSLIGLPRPISLAIPIRRKLMSVLISSQSVVMTDANWVPDYLASQCMRCETSFTLRFRRHHCRNCGHIYCSRCSSHRMPLRKFRMHTKVRVCTTCVNVLQNKGMTSPSPIKNRPSPSNKHTEFAAAAAAAAVADADPMNSSSPARSALGPPSRAAADVKQMFADAEHMTPSTQNSGHLFAPSQHLIFTPPSSQRAGSVPAVDAEAWVDND